MEYLYWVVDHSRSVLASVLLLSRTHDLALLLLRWKFDEKFRLNKFSQWLVILAFFALGLWTVPDSNWFAGCVLLMPSLFLNRRVWRSEWLRSKVGGLTHIPRVLILMLCGLLISLLNPDPFGFAFPIGIGVTLYAMLEGISIIFLPRAK